MSVEPQHVQRESGRDHAAGGDAARVDRAPGRKLFAWFIAGVIVAATAAAGLAAADPAWSGPRVHAGLWLAAVGAAVGAAWSIRRSAQSEAEAARRVEAPPDDPPQRALSDSSAAQLARTEDLLRTAIDTAPLGVAIESIDGKFLSVNPALCAMLGYSDQELRGIAFPDITHPEDRGNDYTLMSRLLRGDVANGRVQKRYRHKDGRWIWAEVAISLVRDRFGEPYRFVTQVRDITEDRRKESRLRLQRLRFKRIVSVRKRMLERERVLMSELNHRVRNNLAALLGLISLYERDGLGSRELAAALRSKIYAMKGVHDAVANGDHSGLDIAELVLLLAREAGNNPDASRVRITGPTTTLPAAQAGALAMIVQELFTNSQKHGALRAEDGFVSVRWDRVRDGDADDLNIEWSEESSLGAGPPREGGVGLKLISGLARSELRGDCRFEFLPQGFSCKIRARINPPEPGLQTGTATDDKELLV